jgi:hypothetical protein
MNAKKLHIYTTYPTKNMHVGDIVLAKSHYTTTTYIHLYKFPYAILAPFMKGNKKNQVAEQGTYYVIWARYQEAYY